MIWSGIHFCDSNKTFKFICFILLTELDSVEDTLSRRKSVNNMTLWLNYVEQIVCDVTDVRGWLLYLN